MQSNDPLILIVDDDRSTRHLLKGILSPQGYRVEEAADGKDALEKVLDLIPDLILLDAVMPEKDGFETVRALKKDPKTSQIPVVMVTALEKTEDRVRALESGSNDILTKPVARAELLVRVTNLLESKAYQDLLRDQQKMLEAEVLRRTFQLKNASLEAIVRLTRAAEYKDQDTGAHIQRMSRYGHLIATELGKEPAWTETFLYATSMHDVGKIGIPDKILLKRGKLDGNEWDLMQQHTIIGGKILENSTSPIIEMGETIALTHHERWDGCGYPNRLAGDKIPLEGRITAIADVFDALTSRRPYKEPFSMEKSLGIIEEERGRAFDPELVDIFIKIVDEIEEISKSFNDDGDSLFIKMTDAAEKR